MDCSYCFLQEYLADNPGFQVYANYASAFDITRRVSAPVSQVKLTGSVQNTFMLRGSAPCGLRGLSV